MRFRIREAPRLLWNTLYKFFGDGCPTMAAALSFYTFFSLPALLSLLLLLVGTVTDPAQVERSITTQVGGLIGRAGAEQVGTILAHTRQSYANQSATAVLGVVALIFGATTAFAQLQDALNRVWEVKPDPTRNELKTFLAKRIFSFGVVLAVAFLLLVSLALSAGLAAFGELLTARLGAPKALLQAGNYVVSFVVVAALFAVMFKLLPDARIPWRDVRAGALLTALLFVVGKSVIGYYLGRTDPGSAYGAAGSLAVVLIWVYYSSMIVLYGAEFTRVWSERFGRGVKPERGAVQVVQEERAVQRG
ncbi:MAG: YihY/virulence factor BrkB family protein [Gemmatimonadaceae bacterium]